MSATDYPTDPSADHPADDKNSEPLPELPEEHVSYLHPALPPETTSERQRRATIRYRCAPATIGKVYLHTDDLFQHAWLQNLSSHGIGMILTLPLSEGLPVEIHLKSLDLVQTFVLTGRIARCVQQLGGDWFVGCELNEELSAEELDLLL